MKDEALKLALEAITKYLSECPDPSEEAVEGLCDAASDARKALAAPVQQSRSDVEPVGTYGEIFESMLSLLRTGLQRDQQIYMMMKDKPLYATSPNVVIPLDETASLAAPAPEERKRQWVGLTDDERLEVAEIDCADEWFWKVCKAIEAKLKEKNSD
jgi:hypothetical protein